MLLAANGWWLWTLLAVIVWIAIAFWPARVASRKGHSFIGYFIFSLIFFPAALIVATTPAPMPTSVLESFSVPWWSRSDSTWPTRSSLSRSRQ